jgi:hypothetical protein
MLHGYTELHINNYTYLLYTCSYLYILIIYIYVYIYTLYDYPHVYIFMCIPILDDYTTPNSFSGPSMFWSNHQEITSSWGSKHVKTPGLCLLFHIKIDGFYGHSAPYKWYSYVGIDPEAICKKHVKVVIVDDYHLIHIVYFFSGGQICLCSLCFCFFV